MCLVLLCPIPAYSEDSRAFRPSTMQLWERVEWMAREREGRTKDSLMSTSVRLDRPWGEVGGEDGEEGEGDGEGGEGVGIIGVDM